jgi:hypothetical protein
MTTGQIVVITLRLLVPLVIFRRPLVGTVAAMLLDGLDVVLVEAFGPGGMGDHYHSIDKVLDLYYLSIAAWTTRAWNLAIPRRLAQGLFFYRVLGVLLFEMIGWRPLLFIFPNLFENWFLFVLVIWRFFPQVGLDTWPQCLRWLAVLAIPKFAQEYLLHIAQAQPWGWVKQRLGL